ncbi:MAG: biotin/lipoyl-binding protein [Candidatus Obscuribacterales bacterium]
MESINPEGYTENEPKGIIMETESRFKQSDPEPDPHDADPPEQKPKKKWPAGKHVITISLSTFLLGAMAVGAYHWYQDAASREETDDAYITGHLHQVSTRIDGTVEKIFVDDNEHVTQGQVLVSLDPRDYQVKVNQALADLKQAERQVKVDQSSVSYHDQDALGKTTNAEGSIAGAVASIARSEALVREAQANILASQAQVTAREAELVRAQADFVRFEHLANEGAVPLSQRDSAKRDYLVAVENLNAARDTVTQAKERLQQAQQTVQTSKAQLTLSKPKSNLPTRAVSKPKQIAKS